MKTFVITISNNKDSVKSANQTRASAKKVGYTEPIHHFEAILPHQWKSVLPNSKANFSLMDPKTGAKFGRPDNLGACFASHSLLWKKCIELNEPILILEHDAIFVDNIPDIEFDKCVNFGRPSHIRPFEMVYEDIPNGLNKITQLNFFGHHAYAVKPEAAKQFIEDIQTRELLANDFWVNRDVYPWLEAYVPYPIVADTDFSTTQVELERGNILKEEYIKITSPDSPHYPYFEKYYPQCLLGQSARYIDA